MRITLLFSILFLCGITKSQTKNDLKGLINKNNIAIHSIQKNLMGQPDTEYISTFRLLLQNQESAVKTFKTNESNSAYFALLVREECLDFLKKNSGNSAGYFFITENEKKLPSAKSDVPVLSTAELKTIEALDPLNPQQLKNLTLTVQ